MAMQAAATRFVIELQAKALHAQVHTWKAEFA